MADVLSVIADIIKQDKQQKREHAKIMREVQKKLKEKETDASEDVWERSLVCVSPPQSRTAAAWG